MASTAIGLRGAKIASFAGVAIAVVNAGLNLVLIPKFGIAGAINSLTISYLVSIVIKLCFGRDLMRKGKE